jgi:hypothetical protein
MPFVGNAYTGLQLASARSFTCFIFPKIRAEVKFNAINHVLIFRLKMVLGVVTAEKYL